MVMSRMGGILLSAALLSPLFPLWLHGVNGGVDGRRFSILRCTIRDDSNLNKYLFLNCFMTILTIHYRLTVRGVPSLHLPQP